MKVIIWAHHGVKNGVYNVESFNQIPTGIKYWVDRLNNWQHKDMQPIDCFNKFNKIPRYSNFYQYSVYTSKKRYGEDMFMLMNKTVSYLCCTGSYYTITFETDELAKQYYQYLKPNAIINEDYIYKIMKISIGDKVVFKENYKNYHIGDIVKIYDFGLANEGLLNPNYTWFCPAPIPNKTLIKQPIPGAPHNWFWIGYDQIPLSYISKYEKL